MVSVTFPATSDVPGDLSSAGYQVKDVPDRPSYYLGRNARGYAALLISTIQATRTVPLLLAGIEAHFSVPCTVRQGNETRTEVLTTVTCLSEEPTVERYFASIVGTMIDQLGESPVASIVEDSVMQLVELFQMLKAAARRPLVGLVGELCVIDRALDTDAAVTAWRSDQSDRYDFSTATLRVDAKTTSSRRRVHQFSYEQTQPPTGTTALIASVYVEQSGGGMALRDFLASIEGRLREARNIGRLRKVVGDTLGESLLAAMEWRFDLHLARSSFALFNLRMVPAPVGPFPPGVSAVHFTSDLTGCPMLADESCGGLDATSTAVLPAYIRSDSE